MNSLSFRSSFIINNESIEKMVYLQINMVKYGVEWGIMRNNKQFDLELALLKIFGLSLLGFELFNK